MKKSNVKSEQLKSFLQTNLSTSPNRKSKFPEQQIVEQYTQENLNCHICNQISQTKSKKCGFCNFRYCTNHLRKKRKLKGAFQRICDNCEDKYLYESYMKYEMKAQQSLAVEEQIVKMKHDSFCDQLEAKQIKFATLKRNLVQIGESYVIKMQQFQSIQQSLAQKSSNLIHQQKQLDRIESQLTEVENGLPRALQDDFLMMQIENEKLTKDLNKLQKRCEELKISILKKEKELETAFSSWQNKVSKDTKAEQKCILF